MRVVNVGLLAGLLAVLLAVLIAGTIHAVYATDAADPVCVPSPTHSPWPPGVDPGPPLVVPFLSAHRGGTNLAPQQTAEAYRSAIAFGATVIEVDLRRLRDGTMVVFHDDAGPDGRALHQVTLAEFKAWNAATGSWAGTAFDPARYQTFAEVLATAGQAGVGLDIEFKSFHLLGGPYREVATAVAAAGLMEKTIWQYYSDLEVPLISTIQGVDPDARFNYNLLGIETPQGLYNRARGRDFSFGSDLATDFLAGRCSVRTASH
ncbi:glycerophosphodiester phosphodiesterase [Plantactinospora sp. WMMB334]|uniref:glycerophosphodiester phosphodiesterase n=1 Tax=Plantactinospora sp. WMMB334 TaxID=3404119 RepID=UPI003B94B07D